MSHLTNCDYCDGDYEYDIEGPDYDVGLTGYAAALNNTTFETHAPDCPVRTFDADKIEEIENKLSRELVEGNYEFWCGEP